MTRLGCAAIMGALLCCAANAEARFTAGINIGSCGKFASRYSQSPNVEDIWFLYAQGYLTGMNLGRDTQAIADGKHSAPMANLDAMTEAEQKAFIRNYCNEHPLANYEDAVRELYIALPKQSVSN